MNRLSYFTAILFSFVVSISQAQYRDHLSYNRLGLQAGLTYGGIHTDNFATSDKPGFMTGFTTRANVYNDLIVVYGVNFYQFVTGVSVKQNLLASAEETDFKDLGVQINLFVGQKIAGEHLDLELGPVLQINGKWQPAEAYKNYYIDGYTLQAKDIEDISKVNLNLAANLSGGFRDFKMWLQYQYGVNNAFKGLNTKDRRAMDSHAKDFTGHISLVIFGAAYYF